MVTKELKVNCPIGLLVKPAGVVCQAAMEFKSHITIEYDGGEANAKSMLSLLGAAIKDQDVVRIVCDGTDENEAAEMIADLLEHRLAG